MGNGILQSISENLQFLLVCAVVIAVIIGACKKHGAGAQGAVCDGLRNARRDCSSALSL